MRLIFFAYDIGGRQPGVGLPGVALITSNNEHDRTPIKYLSVLHHNRTQMQLRHFFFKIVQKYYQLPILDTLFMPTCRNFDVYMHAKNDFCH